MEKAKILRGITSDGSARITVINSRAIVQAARDTHDTSPTASAALGRLLSACSMIGAMMGEPDDRTTIVVSGNGEAGRMICVSDYFGNVKGYVENPHVDPPKRADGKLNVGAAVGKGTLAVIRDSAGGGTQTGTVSLVSGEIAEDIAAYFAESEQIPTLCALGVLVDTDLSCRAAGGVLVQLLPFADEGVAAAIEKNAAALSRVSDLFDRGLTNQQIADIAFAGIPYDVFDEREVSYTCDCSRARMLTKLGSLGEGEIRKLLDEQEADGLPRELEARCFFCGKAYSFGEAELLAEAKSGKTRKIDGGLSEK